jgi:hypothetical protein
LIKEPPSFTAKRSPQPRPCQKQIKKFVFNVIGYYWIVQVIISEVEFSTAFSPLSRGKRRKKGRKKKKKTGKNFKPLQGPVCCQTYVPCHDISIVFSPVSSSKSRISP